MTHTYSAGGSRQAAVVTAIVGMHVAVLLLVVNDRVPVFPTGTRDPGPIEVLPAKPELPVVVRPDEVVLVEPYGQRVEKPDLTIPSFPQTDTAPDVPAVAGHPQHGALPFPDPSMVRKPASLRGQSRDFAAVVRACYPAGARRAGEEGLLMLAVTIGAGGQVDSWRLAESTGFPRLDAAAQCVLEKLRFNAAREGGRAVHSEVTLPIVFRLD